MCQEFAFHYFFIKAVVGRVNRKTLENSKLAKGHLEFVHFHKLRMSEPLSWGFAYINYADFGQIAFLGSCKFKLQAHFGLFDRRFFKKCLACVLE